MLGSFSDFTSLVVQFLLSIQVLYFNILYSLFSQYAFFSNNIILTFCMQTLDEYLVEKFL